MRVFVTGATGFIGSNVARELLAHGHQVLGLTRSESGVAKLEAAGVEPYHGTIEDPDTLRAGAAQADGVIHTAFDHSDMANLPAAAAKDRLVVQALSEELVNSGKPFITTYGVTGLRPGTVLTESFRHDQETATARGLVEADTLLLAGKGVRAISVRPATVVHDSVNTGFVQFMAGIAREKGISGYLGDGSNRWPAVNVTDLAVLYRLALENAEPGTVLHGVGEEGVSHRAIAEEIGRKFGLPVEPVAAEHFGWLGGVLSLDTPASSLATQELLGWKPVGPALLEDI